MIETSDPAPERPSNSRYVVLVFMCALAFVLYLDRICISQAGTAIKTDLGLSNTQFSYVLAAFTLAYAMLEIPIGWWGDKYGSRGVLARIVIVWSVFTALTGAAWNLTSMIAIRFLFGAGEAGAFPNTARILSRWFPTERRGMAQGLVNSISQIGGAIAPPLTALLIKTIGWRLTFAVFCLPGVIWAALFYWWFRDDPQKHSSVNDAERRLIAAGTAQRHSTEHPPIPWALVFRSPQIWLLGFVLTCSAFNSYFYFSWYPTYVKEARLLPEIIAARAPGAEVPVPKSTPGRKPSPFEQLTETEKGILETRSGLLSSIALTGGAIGCIGGGFLIDFLTRWTGNRHRSRRRYTSTVLFLAAVCLLIGQQTDSSEVATIWTAGSVMFTLSTLACWWGAVTDISGRHLGALFGLMNGLGGLGAMASQLFVGVYADYMKSFGYSGRAQWDSIFFVYATVLALGACGWLMVDSGRSVDLSSPGEDTNKAEHPA